MDKNYFEFKKEIVYEFNNHKVEETIVGST